jgi:hypothetical protein
MSALLTFANTATATIYGSLAGALAYHGARTLDWNAVATDETLWRLLVQARDLIDAQQWATGYTTFALRDALDLGTSGGDAAFPFRAAQYLLADLARTNPALLAGDPDSNVSSISDGSASVSYFSPKSLARGTVTIFPKRVMDLIGAYLATTGLGGPQGGTSVAGLDTNPFAEAEDFEADDVR